MHFCLLLHLPIWSHSTTDSKYDCCCGHSISNHPMICCCQCLSYHPTYHLEISVLDYHVWGPDERICISLHYGSGLQEKTYKVCHCSCGFDASNHVQKMHQYPFYCGSFLLLHLLMTIHHIHQRSHHDEHICMLNPCSTFLSRNYYSERMICCSSAAHASLGLHHCDSHTHRKLFPVSIHYALVNQLRPHHWHTEKSPPFHAYDPCFQLNLYQNVPYHHYHVHPDEETDIDFLCCTSLLQNPDSIP